MKVFALLVIMIIVIIQSGIAFAEGKRFLGIGVDTDPQGVIIFEVIKGSPATKVVDTSSREVDSLQPGDIIQAVDGITVSFPEQFYNSIEKNHHFTVKFLRHEQSHEVEAELWSSNEMDTYQKEDFDRKQQIENTRLQNMREIVSRIFFINQQIYAEQRKQIQNSALLKELEVEKRWLELEKLHQR
jgi:membrane-associated protease RseP (regulator of RpoE activity)